MSFFKSIEQHLDGLNLNIVVGKNDDGLTVSVLPQPKCKDEAMKQLVPILLKGTAEELDAQFAGIIQQPLQKISGITSNIVEFEKATEIQAEKTAIAKAKKDEKKKLTDKADKYIDEANKLIKEDKISGAILKIEAALKIYPESKKAKDLLKKHKPDAGMFDEAQKIEEIAPVIAEVVSEQEVEAVKREVPKGPNVIINKVSAEEPTSMKEVGMEEQQIAQTIEAVSPVIPPTVIESPVALVVPEHNTPTPIVPVVPVVEAIAITPIVPPVVEAPTLPPSLKGTPKPMRMDMEPLSNYEARLNAWLFENPQPANPAATIPSDNPIAEEKSVTQEMEEESLVYRQMERREAEFEALKVVPPVVPPNTDIETLG